MATLPTTAAKVLAVARDELGTVESPAGSNRTKYGAWFGLDGNPWCAMFVVWCFHRAGAGDLRTVLREQGLAYTPYFASACRKAGWAKVSPGQAKPGDIVFFDFPDAVYRIQHIGIAESRSGSTVTCLEGNTSVTSNDNGGKVMRRSRAPSLIDSIYRPQYAGEGGLTVAEVDRIIKAITEARAAADTDAKHLDAHLHQVKEAVDANDRRLRELLSRLPSTAVPELRRNLRRATAATGYPERAIEGGHTLDEDQVEVADLAVPQLAAHLARQSAVLDAVEVMIRDATGQPRAEQTATR